MVTFAELNKEEEEFVAPVKSFAELNKEVVAPVKSFAELNQEEPQGFDPEGIGYDDATAAEGNIVPDETGHSPSFDGRTGQLLKGINHESIDLTIQEEKRLGNEIVKREDGRYYSQPKETEFSDLVKSDVKDGGQADFTLDIPADFTLDIPLEQVEQVEAPQFNLNTYIKATQDKQAKEKALVEERIWQELGQVDIGEMQDKIDNRKPLSDIEQIWLARYEGVEPARLVEMVAVVGAAIISGGTSAVATSILGPYLGAAAGVGSIVALENLTLDAFHGDIDAPKSLEEVPETAKQVGESLLIGFGLGTGLGLAGKVLVGFFGSKAKTLANHKGLTIDELNKLLGAEAKSKGIKVAEVLDDIIAEESKLPEGAKVFKEFLEPNPTKGMEGIKSPLITQQFKKKVAGPVGEFEGSRIAGVPEKENLIASGIEFQSPRVRDALTIQREFVSPQTIKVLNEESVRTVLIYNKVVPYTPAVVRRAVITAQPVEKIAKKIAAETGDSVGEVMQAAKTTANVEKKGIKEVLVDQADRLPTNREAVDKVMKQHTAEHIYEGKPEIINSINQTYREAVEDVMSDPTTLDLFNDISRPVTTRKGDTVFKDVGKLKPHVQAIADKDKQISNALENFVETFKTKFADDVTVTGGQVDNWVAELPDSDLAMALKDPARTGKELMDIQIRVAAAGKYAQVHFVENVLPGLRRLKAGEITPDAMLDIMGVQMQLLDHVGIGGSGFGRGLRQMQDLAAKAESHKLMAKKIDDLFRMKNGKVNTQRLTDLIEDLETMSPEDTTLAIAKLANVSSWDQYRFIMKAGMLGGSPTQERNFFGNVGRIAAHVVGDIPFTNAAHGALQIIQGKPREKFMRETVQAMYAIPGGFRDGWSIFLKKMGSSQIDATTASKFDLVRGSSRVYINPLGEGWMGHFPRTGKAIGYSLRAMDAVDGAAKEMGTAIQTNVMAYRYARLIARKMNIEDVGSKEFNDLYVTIKNNPTDELLSLIGKDVKTFNKEIEDVVLELVFQQPTSNRLTLKEAPALKEMPNSTQKMTQMGSDPVGSLNEIPKFLVRMMPVMDSLLPFLTAPLNIVKYGAERTFPLAPVISFAKIISRRAAKVPLKLDEEIAKNAMGAAALATTAMMVHSGHLTGGVDIDPESKGIRKLDRSTGKTPYTFNAFGKSANLMNFEPFGPMIAFYADAVTLAMSRDRFDTEAMGDLVASFGNNLTKKSTFASMAFMWEVSTGEWDKAKSTAAFMLVGNTVPFSGTLRTIGNAIGDPKETKGGSFVDRVKNNIPIMRNSLPSMYDVWGREVYTVDSWAKQILEDWVGVHNEDALQVADIITKLILPLPAVHEPGQEPIDLYMRVVIDNMKHDEKFPLADGPGRDERFTPHQYAAFRKQSGQKEMEVVLRYLSHFGRPGSVQFEQAAKNPRQRELIKAGIAKLRRKVRKGQKAKFMVENGIK